MFQSLLMTLHEKSLVGLLLCATSVFSVSLWLTEFAAKLTTENTEVAQRRAIC